MENYLKKIIYYKLINNVSAKGIKHKSVKASNFENAFIFLILPISVKLWKTAA